MDPLLGAGLSHKPSRSRNPTSLLTALLLLAAHVLEGLTFGFLSPLLPFFYTDIANDITRGNAGAVFGLILSSYLVALWAATPLLVWAVGTRRVSAQVAVVGCALVSSGALVGVGLSDTVLGVVLGRMGCGVGAAGVCVGTGVLAATVVGGKRQLVGAAGLLGSGGTVVGAVVGGWAGQALGVGVTVRYAACVSAGLYVVLAAAHLMHFRGARLPPITSRSLRPVSSDGFATATMKLSQASSAMGADDDDGVLVASAAHLYRSLRAGEGAAAAPAGRSSYAGVRYALATLPSSAAFVGMHVAYALAFSAWEVSAPLFAARALHVGSGWVGLFVASGIAAATLAEVTVFLRLAACIPLKAIPVVGMVGLASGVATAPLLPPAAFAALAQVVGLSHALVRPSLTVADHAEVGWVDDAAASHLRRVVSSAARAIGPLLLGIAYDYSVPFLTSDEASEAELEQAHVLAFWLGGALALVAALFTLALPIDLPLAVEPAVGGPAVPFQVPVSWLEGSAGEHTT